ncbi:UbiA family prenyltransferase [Bdellovibrio bacteriovorus]|uniref:UbiA family prenyltransferase n=1 Tax=Bdellovibrio bacteriovorus TaxID=959 RepID=UPI0021D32657|nr:UbiA family prenyltransferase [Bdellovibrio bacteriovorus]UXR63783.1 UbiA family prenyltransferase [Bdellovibrio bacteriovorus]
MNYLVVDLDESLIKTDLLYEQAFSFLKKNPFNIFRMLLWLFTGGRLGLKNNMAAVIHPTVENLPYRKEVLAYIDEQKRQHHTIVLASASPQVWVQRVANHLGIFDHAIGSKDFNLKGLSKYHHVKDTIGTGHFKYVGDSKSDLEIWSNCGSAITVNATPKVIKKLRDQSILIKEISDKLPKSKLLLQQMRVHQWAKNTLLFLPLFAAHQLNLTSFLNVTIGFFSFGFAASAVYILNDLIDIDADRNHHSKKNRPLASGSISIKDALLTLGGASILSLIFALHVGISFLGVIFAYWCLNFLYSFYLKKEVILDIILLSGMYTVRLFAGAAATGILLSHWLLSFSTLFFFSLACVKRFTELIRSKNKPSIDGRGYRNIDQTAVLNLGIGTGLLSILVFLLYLRSPDVGQLYTNQDRLWLLTPVLLYWLGRLWLLTCRDEVHDDPVVFAIKDKISWICLAFIAFTIAIAM